MRIRDLLRRRAVAVEEVEVVNAPRHLRGDVYHELLRASWPLTIAVFATVWVILNVLFAVGFRLTGGVAGMSEGSLVECFYFSVQTMGTIGYGSMYPTTDAAHLLVTVESFVGVIVVALATGLIFTKFAIPRARVQFAREIVIGPYDGLPTLQIRLGNERSSQILEAIVRVVMFRTEVTKEGVTMYRMVDVALERERAPTLSRSWTVQHRIDERSPLYRATPETLAREEVEFLVTVVGTDDTSAQPLHARHRYETQRVRFGARYADMLSERDDGGLRLDMAKFHAVVPTEPTENFPFPRAASADVQRA